MIPQELLERYLPLKLLHHGIGGEVWLVEHRTLACRRIIKTVEKRNPCYESLVREAGLLQQFHHPAIPIIYDLEETDTATYLVEEFIEGETLRQYLQRRTSLPYEALLEYAIQLCGILRYLHSPAHRILHLDMKPENILISNRQMKLIDFGSAICQERQEEAGVQFGSRGFAAPEQYTAGRLSEETDLYAFGKILQYMICYTSGVPKKLGEIVRCCLRQGKKRYSCAAQPEAELLRLRERAGSGRRKPEDLCFAVTGLPTSYHSARVAMQLAVYLRERYGGNILLLDCTAEHLSERLERSLEEERCFVPAARGFVFEWEDITVAKRVAPQEIKGWRGRGYRCIVCDFGDRSPLLAEIPFALCICAGSLSEWTYELWQERTQQLLALAPALVVTDGDARLLKEWGDAGRTGLLAPFASLEECPRENKRLFRRLLRNLLQL